MEDKLRSRFREVAGGYDRITSSQFLEATGPRSSLFGKRLFDFLDDDKSGDISFEEFQKASQLLQDPTNSKGRIAFIFSLLDLNSDGAISGSELYNVLSASVEEGYLVLPHGEKLALADTLLQLFDLNKDGAISLDEFQRVMIRYPDILDGLHLKGISNICPPQDQPHSSSGARCGCKQAFKSVVDWVSNNPQRLFTYSSVGLALLGAFLVVVLPRAWEDCSEVDARKVGSEWLERRLTGWYLDFAKGCGMALKVVLLLILLPVSRSLMTNLRSTFLRTIYCFDDSVNFHKMLGTAGFWLSWAHGCLHYLSMRRKSDPKQANLWSQVYPNEGSQPSIEDLLSEPPSVSGFALLFIYTAAAMFALDYPRKLFVFKKNRILGVSRTLARLAHYLGKFLNNFNCFWYSHHLYYVFCALLMVHPAPQTPNASSSSRYGNIWEWMSIPILVYTTERILRLVRSDSSSTRVLAAQVLAGDVIYLRLAKPRGMVPTAGQYVFIKCPSISRFEWHPFTLTSSPGESFLELHIRADGDWTTALRDIVSQSSRATSNNKAYSSPSSVQSESQEDEKSSEEKYYIDMTSPRNPDACAAAFRILVDGPFGAPCQNYKDYSVVVLIGAGIGVTPFASVLGELLSLFNAHKCRRCSLVNLPQSVKTRKVYFLWTIRSRCEAGWFKHLLEAISMQDAENLIDINIHITSITQARDFRVMLLNISEARSHESRNLKASHSAEAHTVTHFGRPNWAQLFGRVKAENQAARFCGVFFCGPSGLGRVLRKEAHHHSSASMKFEYHQEIFSWHWHWFDQCLQSRRISEKSSYASLRYSLMANLCFLVILKLPIILLLTPCSMTWRILRITDRC